VSACVQKIHAGQHVKEDMGDFVLRLFLQIYVQSEGLTDPDFRNEDGAFRLRLF